MSLKLVLANKAYSSWSLRPWILLAHFKIPFEEIVIPLDLPETRAAILKHSPTGKVPALIDGAITIWESLAIMEYVAEKYPQKAIWPKAKAARAHARAISSEMHAGFQALRQQCPMNFRRPVRRLAFTPETLADIARIEAAWGEARRRFGKAGPFLFGRFSAADAMFAPVVNRLHVYDAPVNRATRDYMDAMSGLPSWKAWSKDAEAEAWRIAKYESV
jgi:glutathione S-transferase